MCQPDHFPIGGGTQEAFDPYPGVSGWSTEHGVIFRASLRKTVGCRTPRQEG